MAKDSNAATLGRDGPAGKAPAAAAAATRVSGPATSARAAGQAGAGTPVPGQPSAASAARLGLAVGGDRLLVDLSEAGEIVPLPSLILPVPLTRDWLLGVTNLRGSLHTVADLRRFALGQPTEAGKEARILALADGLDFNVTLVVTRMLGLRNTASMKPVEPPAAGQGEPPSFISCAGRDWLGQVHVDADGQFWRELILSRLALDHEFLLIGRN